MFQMQSNMSTPSSTFLSTRSISHCSFLLAPMASSGPVGGVVTIYVYNGDGESGGEAGEEVRRVDDGSRDG